MGDYIPQEELEKFLANCNDAAAQKAAKEAAEKAKIQADNVGHKLLSKMGWKEGNFCHAYSITTFSSRTNTRSRVPKMAGSIVIEYIKILIFLTGSLFIQV